MGRCITIITLTGAASLGLLTGSLTYQSLQGIPELIRSLNNQTSLTSSAGAPVVKSVSANLTVSNILNLGLASLSTWLFSTAYRYSPAAGKHPYLIYSAMCAPLALVALYSTGGKTLLTFDGKSLCGKQSECAKAPKKEVRKKAAAPAEESLELSYIHVSEDSLSVSSDSSPETPANEPVSATSSIEEEVESALSKKEFVNGLETVGTAYSFASYVAGAGFAICAIGVIGDSFFL